MADDQVSRLYSPDILALAINLADYPLSRPFTHHSVLRSRSCGSEIEIGLDEGDDGTVSSLGLRVTACAIGQAAAAIFANGGKGRTAEQIGQSTRAIELWLTGESAEPCWPGFAVLHKVKPFTGRHEALLLPWRAAILALSIHDTRR